MKTFLEYWIETAAALFPQALAGGPEFAETAVRPAGESAFGFSALLAGAHAGRVVVVLDGALASAPLLGEGVDQKQAWGELISESLQAAAAQLQAGAGAACRVEKFGVVEDCAGAEKSGAPRAFALRSGERSWTILVYGGSLSAESAAERGLGRQGTKGEASDAAPAPGLEILLDVELEASLRFGSRELPLGKILELGPGDVVPLDRQVSDPVDLIVGDKIVARGEVVLVNGNFGMRVTEVATPRRRLESIRCLF